MAVEKSDADGTFECCETTTDRRVIDLEAPSGTGKGTLPHQGSKDLNVVPAKARAQICRHELQYAALRRFSASGSLPGHKRQEDVVVLRTLCRLSFFAALVQMAVTPTFAEGGPDISSFQNKLIGTWQNLSERPGPGGTKAFVQSEVTFTNQAEEVITKAFADAELTRPLFTYRSIGPYRILRRSSAVPGAWEADLTNERSVLTVHMNGAPLIKALGFDDCAGLTVEQERDVGDGCAAPLFAVTRCVDQELLHVSEDGATFHFGDSATDRCRVRPTKLDKVPYTRR